MKIGQVKMPHSSLFLSSFIVFLKKKKKREKSSLPQMAANFWSIYRSEVVDPGNLASVLIAFTGERVFGESYSAIF